MAKNVDNFDVNSISECNYIENNSTGYILKVDLEYPDELHALHNDYPLAPEMFMTCCQIIVKTCRRIWDKSW